ncbi:MAG: metallophosphoesterase [Firmicutes bacterium]|nr:metallophosphoesterase [Bacillota bacterium]
MKLRTLLVTLLLLPLGAASPSLSIPPVVQIALDDGPHVRWEGHTATVTWVREGQAVTATRQGAFSLVLPGIAGAPLKLDPAPLPPAVEEVASADRILAVSDVHGNFQGLVTLLKAQGVIDEKQRWRYGRGHLVVVGDVADRGAQVTEIYWLLRSLEAQAQQAGGATHLLLGNHEAMVLAGDLRYVNPKYLRSVEPPPSAQFDAASELGRWLRSRPVMLRLGEFLFVHGGVSPEVLEAKLEVSRINATVRGALGTRPKDASGEAALLLGNRGPLWYRGLLPEGGPPQADDAHLQAVLAHFRVKALVVGHTTLPALAARHERRVYGIDAGLKDDRPGEAWIYEKRQIWRGRADGGKEPL